MGRAYAVAVRDRGEPLDVRTEEPDEHLRLGLAQLREICCHVRDRAVVLADLNSGAGLLRRRGVAVGRERRSQSSRTAVSWHLCQRRRVANFETVQALPCERAHGRVATGVSQIAEGLDCDVVICVGKQGMAIVGQGEKLRGAATAAQLATNLALRNLAYPAGGDQRVEVATNRRGCEAEAGTQGTCALRTAIMQGPRHPVTGASVVRARGSGRLPGRCVGDHRGFHNSNVTYLPPACTHPLLRGVGRRCPSVCSGAYFGSEPAAYHRAR